MWLDRVKQVLGDDLDITWKNFSLEQINSKEGGDWKVWEQKGLHEARALLASVAGEAAKRQGDEAFDKFHLALLSARHAGDRAPLNEDDPIVKIAEESGLDAAQFKKDLEDPALLEIVAKDHEEAVGTHGAFGTPTFIFEDGQSSYIKTFIPPEEESLEAFEHFIGLMSKRSYIGEVKRPQPPWPKGAV